MRLEFKRNNPHAVVFEKTEQGIDVTIGGFMAGESTDLDKKEINILIDFLKAAIQTEDSIKPESKDLTITIRKQDEKIFIGLNGVEEEMNIDYFLSLNPDEFREEIKDRLEYDRGTYQY